MAKQTNQGKDNFRDSVATIDKEGKRSWIYAQQPQGKYYNWRTILTILYVIVLFSVPFIKVHGHPFFLFNIPERKFILFGSVFWPQDVIIFGLTMVTFMVFIIVFTVAFGRIFCGWVCPQTIFMDMIFRRIEFWIEGDGPKQRRLDEGPWDAEKIRKRGLKYVIFYIISFIVGNTLLAYVIGVDELFKIITEPIGLHTVGFSAMIIFSIIFFFLFSWFREQACTVVCPYGRLQGVLLDKNSIIVAYDHVRGEERGKFKKNEERVIGDCIDCNQCVNVCPTGIDIRNGTQLECTNCTACIDACDFMMEKVNLPKGLIRYTSENQITNKEPFKITTRNKAYAVVLLILLSIVSTLLFTRSNIDTTILRAKGMLYQEVGTDSISNLYTLYMVNKTYEDIPVTLMVDGGAIKSVGNTINQLKKESTGEMTFFVVMPKNKVPKRKNDIHIKIFADKAILKTVKTGFFSPGG